MKKDALNLLSLITSSSAFIRHQLSGAHTATWRPFQFINALRHMKSYAVGMYDS